MTASRPEGAKELEARVQELIPGCTGAELFALCLECIATLCVEYAREQVEAGEKREAYLVEQRDGVMKGYDQRVLECDDLRAQLQTLRGEHERLREVMRETVKEVGYLGLHVGGDGPCVACDAAQHLRAALAPRRG